MIESRFPLCTSGMFSSAAWALSSAKGMTRFVWRIYWLNADGSDFISQVFIYPSNHFSQETLRPLVSRICEDFLRGSFFDDD
ncbi:MAG: hypothetical protein WBY88_18075, partial [Desulfosarcina sp.]